MKALYITSVQPHSGKTAVCLALGRKLKADGYAVGYLKPVSTRPWRTPAGQLADEDAAFVRDALGLKADASSLSPVLITPSTLREHLRGILKDDLLLRIQEAAKAAAKGKQILLLEGGTRLCEASSVDLSAPKLAEALGAPAIALVRYADEMSLVDDAFSARLRFGKHLLGVILNQIPEPARPFAEEYARPFLVQKGIPVLGILPHVPRLSALSLGELIDLLEAEVLTERIDPTALAETFTVGAMSAEQALSRFRRYQHKAVITGGDRTDIQLAALETSTVVLILTGNLHPSPLIIQQAETLGIPILLVKENTMETVETIERAYGKTRLGQHEKLETFTQLMVENVDLEVIYSALELS